MKKPTVFGKYLLLERINVGGMAEVFIAKAFGVEGFERILAIKKILPTMAEDEEFITMFIDEARISVQLNHANIVHIHELGKHDETYYIAMEYVAGRDLRTILERYRRNKEIMPTAQAVFVASKICEGLDYAHRKKDARGQDLGIIHRDVSPQNILISYEGEVKIIDFGIAKAANRSQKTQAGILKGKFGYMSPEQVRGLPIDRRSDIFAVGVILYEMLTGEKLFVGESDFSTLEKVRNADVPAPRQFNPNIPPGLEKVVLKALAREQEDRYQSASDLQEDLMRFLLAGEAIYSAKHLSSFMKEAFAEELARENEKMERYASIERPDQIESSGVTATVDRARRRPASDRASPPPSEERARGASGEKRAPRASGPVAATSLSAVATGPAVVVPPPTAAELAELDQGGDKTQIVDGHSGEIDLKTQIGISPFDEGPSSVVTESGVRPNGATHSLEDAESESSGISTSTALRPLENDDALDETLPPQGRSSTEKRADSGEKKSKSGNKPKVIIGDGAAYSGATVIGPRPSDEEDSEVGKATHLLAKGNGAAPPLDAEVVPTVAKGRQAMRVDDDVRSESQLVTQSQVQRSGLLDLLPPEKRRLAIIGGALALVLLVLVVAGVLLFSGGTGTLVAVSSVSGVQIQVDGKPVKPFAAVELEPGQHEVTAIAPGMKPWRQTVQVKSGRETKVVVSLSGSRPEKAREAPPAEVAEAPRPEPPDKGKAEASGEVPESLKAEAKVELPKPEPGKTEPAAAKEEAKQPEPAKAASAKVTAKFISPEAVDVYLDGERVGRTPTATVKNLDAGKTYKVEAKRAGFKTWEDELVTDPARPEVEVMIPELEELPPPEKPAEPVAKREAAPRKERDSPPPKKAVKATGKLACSTKPAGAEVWVDGKKTGLVTPVPITRALELPVGTHKVVFKYNGKSAGPFSVEIQADEIAKLVNVPVE